MRHKTASVISILGHPLFTIPVFVATVMFKNENFKKAFFIAFLIIGCIFLPLILRLFVKTKNGTYTNFDVSDRIQRKTVFTFVIPFMVIVTFVLFKTQQNHDLCLSIVFATILVSISQGVNFFIKSSLHVSLNIYLSFLVMMLNLKIGIMVFLFTGLLGWSRIVLGRHTMKEVLVGGVIGLSISLLMFYIEVYL